MEVTDKMVKLALAEAPFKNGTPFAPPEHWVRGMLVAALADVPEPLRASDEFCCKVDDAYDRIAKADGKAPCSASVLFRALAEVMGAVAPLTAKELAVLVREGRGGKYDAALAELVRRAEGK